MNFPARTLTHESEMSNKKSRPVAGRRAASSGELWALAGKRAEAAAQKQAVCPINLEEMSDDDANDGTNEDPEHFSPLVDCDETVRFG